jgi:WS/DGAT/MGAT family acyltransferase
MSGIHAHPKTMAAGAPGYEAKGFSRENTYMQLSLLDALFFVFERQDSPKHVAGLQIFELPPGRGEDYVAELVDRMRATPVKREPFNLKLDWPMTRWPRWKTVEVDLDRHVIRERLPAPGSMQQLEELVGRLHAPQLDRSRPVWEVYIIEGLENHRFATYSKIHHAYADGLTMVNWQLKAMGGKSGKPLVPVWAYSSKPRKKSRKSFVQGALDRNRQLMRQLRAYPELFAFVSKVFLQWIGLRRGSLMLPMTGPRTAFNRPPGSSARSTVTASLSLDRIRQVCAATDSTINEVVLAVCDMALQRYLDENETHPEQPLTLQMPVSLAKRVGDGKGGGNQVALAWLKLGTERDPLARLAEVRASCHEVKENFVDALSPEAITTFTILMATVAQTLDSARIDEMLPPGANALISNVPGPQKTLYLGDARMLAFYPISTILPGIALNITVLSYDGVLFFGITSCRDALPGMEESASFIYDAFDALFEAAVQSG